MCTVAFGTGAHLPRNRLCSVPKPPGRSQASSRTRPGGGARSLRRDKRSGRVAKTRPAVSACLQLGLTGLCEAVQGNFLDMPFEDCSFDGAYAIEATCHAPKVGLRAKLGSGASHVAAHRRSTRPLIV